MQENQSGCRNVECDKANILTKLKRKEKLKDARRNKEY